MQGYLIKIILDSSAIIQRDYAQGRPDKSYIREAFLRNIVDALKNSKRLKLDFIYSAECGSNLLPLDGQQRLTTLWLLHWYIALRANKLTEENAEIFKKFSYQTRASSEDFCRKLCQIENFMQYKSDKNLFEYISKSKWFYSYWMQDPTIQSMLVMLCGQSGKSETKDNIVKVFEEDKIEDFEKYWDILVSKNCSILFYHLTLSQFGLSDDLYIKMNARGKSLTAFENFKADLVNFLKDKAKDNPYLKEEYLSPSDGIPLKFDTNWMDVFWESRSKSHRVDEIYNSFLNRFFFNEYLISIKTDEDENNNKNKNTLHLHTFVINDVNCSYQGLDPFFKNVNPCELFINLNQVLDRYQSNLSEVVNKYFDKYTFIPSYDKDKNSNDKVIEITQAERVVFFAICKYLKEGAYEKTSFDRWMRVVKNLVSGKDETGSEIRSYSAVLEAIKIMDSEDINSHSIYESLERYKTNHEDELQDINKFSVFFNRWIDEVEKAVKIREEGDSLHKDGLSWEEVIRIRENWSFFNGSIPFLYRNALGKVDWSDFDKKFSFAKEYFIEDSNHNSECVTKNENANLLKRLISYFNADDYGNVLWWKKRCFNNQATTWLYYLLNNNISGPIHKLLSSTEFVVKSQSSGQSEQEHDLYLLSQTKLLDYILEHKDLRDSWIRYYHNHRAIYPSSTGIFLNASGRDKFLNSSNIQLDPSIKVSDSGLLFGSDIDFSFSDDDQKHSELNGEHFRWDREDYIYLLNKTEIMSFVNPKTKDKQYFRFCTKGFNDEQITKYLNKLVELRKLLKNNHFDEVQNLITELETI